MRALSLILVLGSTLASAGGGSCGQQQDFGPDAADPLWMHRRNGEYPWVRRPTQQDALRLIPDAVMQGGRFEQVWMRCELTADGGLTDCVVDVETRSGIGLGNAALAAAKLVQVEPATAHGVPVGGLYSYVVMTFEPREPAIYPRLDSNLSREMPGGTITVDRPPPMLMPNGG